MKRRGMVIGAIAVLGVLGAGVLVWTLSRPPSIEDVAERYLAALEVGDYGTISEMTGSPLDEAAEAAVADAFAGAEYGTEAEVDGMHREGDVTEVEASIDLNGDRHTVSFGLVLEGNLWTVVDYLAVLEVASTLGDSVWVGDALVPVGSVGLLPAVYPVAPAPRGILDGGTEVTVSSQTSVSVALEPTLSAEATAQAQAQLDAYLDECTTSAQTLPEACGIRVPWAADLVSLDGLTYRIDERPAIALSPDDDSFAATGGILVVTARGTTHAGSPGEHTYRADDWALYGALSFSGDEMVLAVR